MKNSIEWLKITNFKSIKHLEIDCKRVNVFIGKPNVGKSNILEAIGMLGCDSPTEPMFEGIIRYEEISNLFFDDDAETAPIIECDKISASLVLGSDQLAEFGSEISEKTLNRNLEQFGNGLYENSSNKTGYSGKHFIFSLDGKSTEDAQFENMMNSPIRKYHFKEQDSFPNKSSSFLVPPFGSNLFAIVNHYQELRKEIADIFLEYGLEFVAYKKESKFEIQKKIDGYVTKYNYSSTADTFQRLIFYFAVIDSNKDAVLVLEEPEVHSFPPYTKDLADRIVASEDNQFFITTHSPYMLQNLVSDLGPEELNVFITYYEDYQTKVKKLTPADLQRVSDFGIDLFYNLDQFIENE